MTEDALLKYAQPFLIGIGLVVVLNLWSIIQSFLAARQSKDQKTEQAIEKLTESVIKLSARLDQVVRDLNNIGRMVKDIKNKS